MLLRNIHIEKTYSSDSDDLLDKFYNPVLEQAKSYDRITGFFSPRVLAVAARGFCACARNDCKIRIITSIEVDPETYDAINEAESIKDIDSFIEGFNPDAITDGLDYNYYQLFMYLYAKGNLQLRIAVTTSGNGIMHEKIGIITDENGDAISFSGSNNETAAGWTSNIEEFKTFNNWQEGAIDYYKADRNKFDRYWSNSANDVKIVSFDEATKNKLIRKTNANEIPLDELIEKIRKKERNRKAKIIDNPFLKPTPEERDIREYQKIAIQHWKDNGYVSTFEMATGTGKTFTAVSALKQFLEEHGQLHVVVAVPLVTLLLQWQDELMQAFGNKAKIIVATTTIQNDWRKQIREIQMRDNLGVKNNYAIIVTYDTFCGKEFCEAINAFKNDDIILLADEMHNLVTENCIKALNNVSNYRYKLGLSATPVRLWRPDESDIVLKNFGNNPYKFTLKRAIEEHFLVPYYYKVIPIRLTDEEFEKYLELSVKIAKLMGHDEDDEDAEKVLLDLMLKRSRIKKNAINKVSALEEKIVELNNDNKFYRALIYTDNMDSLQSIQRTLTLHNIDTARFTGIETIDERQRIIEGLEDKTTQAVVAIKCLDEGVDIPSARLAFFTSSNTDPREYVQRLGRVLRLDKKNDKQYSIIYDFIVTPPENYPYEDIGERTAGRNLMKNEVIRAKFFIELAKNKEEAQIDVNDIVDNMNMTFTEDELELKPPKKGEE